MPDQERSLAQVFHALKELNLLIRCLRRRAVFFPAKVPSKTVYGAVKAFCKTARVAIGVVEHSARPDISDEGEPVRRAKVIRSLNGHSEIRCAEYLESH